MLYDFGARLTKLRREKNLTQQNIVDKAKAKDPDLRLTDSSLGKYENDNTVPRLTEAAIIAEILEVSLDYLADGEKCRTLSLKELNDGQVQLLVDMATFFKKKKSSNPEGRIRTFLTEEESLLLARMLDQMLK